MLMANTASEFRLVNGSTGDPGLYIDYPGRDNALLFDAGDNGGLDMERLGDLEAVFVTHHHVDHFVGLDRIVRANLDKDKTLHVYGPDGTIRKVYDRIKSYEYQYFPFQKICLQVHDVLPGRLRAAALECTRRFPEPAVEEADWAGPVLFENADLAVEAAFADHTVACLAFALVETAWPPGPCDPGRGWATSWTCSERGRRRIRPWRSRGADSAWATSPRAISPTPRARDWHTSPTPPGATPRARGC